MWSNKKSSDDANTWRQYNNGKPQATDLRPKKRIQWEKIEQKKAVAWFHLTYPQYYDLFYHIANEGRRVQAWANELKALGMKKGMLDLHLDVPRKARNGVFYYGLRIEVKPNKDDTQSALTPAQENTINKMNEQGYFACVCFGYDQIREVIEWYLA